MRFFGYVGHGAECPPATQDLVINTRNRQFAIDKYLYGPPNPAQPSRYYWKKLASKIWNMPIKRVTPVQLTDIKSMRCGNCVAFDISPRMERCMLGPVTYAGKLGYCWMHNFKCASLRTCATWAGGGPIVDDAVSYESQERMTRGGR